MLRMAGKMSSTIAKLNTTTTAACKKHRKCYFMEKVPFLKEKYYASECSAEL